MFRKPTPKGFPERAFTEDWESLRLSLPSAFLLYLAFALAVYFPVILGYRFFWEDFFIQGYPIRDFSYHSVAIKHQLPFWNPYSWPWAPLLADAQCGFWYPANLLQILISALVVPNAQSLPVIAPELSVILHMVLAAAGAFQLSRKKFGIPDLAAVLVGLCYGFGVRMAAEQNHEMQIYQLALLPWEILLLMRSWNSWRAAVGFGVLFGISFLAGQPQTYFFIALFATGLTVSEVLKRHREAHDNWFVPVLRLAFGGLLSVGVAAIQLLPSLELTSISARARISYSDANSAALTFGHLLTFFVPRIDGEYAGWDLGFGGVRNYSFWHWEAIFYWGCLAELLAIYAALRLWKDRRSGSEWSRHLSYVVWFSIFAIAFGLGSHLGFNWLFWRFVPIFNQLRSPNRMLWFVWFIGSIYSGIGLTYWLRHREHEASRRFLLRGAVLFGVLNLLAATGMLDLLTNHGHIREGMFGFTLPSLVVSLLTIGLVLWARKQHSSSKVVILVVALIACELWFFDVVWNRNELKPPVTLSELEAAPRADGQAQAMHAFEESHASDHSKLVIREPDSYRRYANMGMHVRLPIEYASDTVGLTGLNPMRLARILPPADDSDLRMSIMGVTTELSGNGRRTSRKALPYLSIYHDYRIASSDSIARIFYADSGLDYHRTVLLDRAPGFKAAVSETRDSVWLTSWNENDLTVNIQTSRPGVLVVNDLYYPDWMASIDGTPVTIQRAFTSLRAIEVPAGEHTIRLRYESSSFRAGATITLLTLGVSGIALLGLGRKRKTPAGTTGALRI